MAALIISLPVAWGRGIEDVARAHAGVGEVRGAAQYAIVLHRAVSLRAMAEQVSRPLAATVAAARWRSRSSC